MDRQPADRAPNKWHGLPTETDTNSCYTSKGIEIEFHYQTHVAYNISQLERKIYSSDALKQNTIALFITLCFANSVFFPLTLICCFKTFRNSKYEILKELYLITHCNFAFIARSLRLEFVLRLYGVKTLCKTSRSLKNCLDNVRGNPFASEPGLVRGEMTFRAIVNPLEFGGHFSKCD